MTTDINLAIVCFCSGDHSDNEFWSCSMGGTAMMLQKDECTRKKVIRHPALRR